MHSNWRWIPIWWFFALNFQWCHLQKTLPRKFKDRKKVKFCRSYWTWQKSIALLLSFHYLLNTNQSLTLLNYIFILKHFFLFWPKADHTYTYTCVVSFYIIYVCTHIYMLYKSKQRKRKRNGYLLLILISSADTVRFM